MATVELAAALPVLMILVFAGIFGVQVSDARARCADAAREVARAAARGDGRAVELGQKAVSGRGQISVLQQGDLIVATVSLRVRPAGIELAEITVTERATAALEPTALARPSETARPGSRWASGSDRAPT
jgi:Flp pilus assembly protein TadG